MRRNGNAYFPQHYLGLRVIRVVRIASLPDNQRPATADPKLRPKLDRTDTTSPAASGLFFLACHFRIRCGELGHRPGENRHRELRR